VNYGDDANSRLETLARLANTRLSFIETIQVDAAHSKIPHIDNSRFEDVRLAVLTASTIDHLLAPIRVAGLRRGLRIETYAATYRLYRQELLDLGSQLFAFHPDTVLFTLVARDFIGAIPITASSSEADHVITAAIDDLRGLWRLAHENLSALVIQQSFLDVAPPLFGGLDAVVPGAPARLVAKLNAKLADAALEDGVLWLDAAHASSRDGLDAWFDVVRWLQGKLEIAPQAASSYGELVARLIAAARGKSKKCLVLDLDNTLWGGVIGDDGLEGIVLGEGNGVGEAYLALQRYAKSLKDRGILLAVCSKNDIATAEAAFRENPEMLLKRVDFAAFVVNWNDKVENLRAIARQLNIGIDSLVLVDDNPVERAFVRDRLPMVAVPELPPDPANYVRCIAEGGYFESISFTQEDKERASQYSAKSERDDLRLAASDMDTFLRHLDMSVIFGQITSLNVARATQLINKTNQFNTTTIRRTESELRRLASQPGSLLLQFRLVDRFGDNGLVSVMLLKQAEEESGVLDMINWVMSCRVFGRQLEDEAMNILIEAVRDRGVHTLRAAFIPTTKNAVIKDLFGRLGFSRTEAEGRPDAPSLWTLKIADYVARPTWIARSEDMNA
jgi:FkbH-like protein